MRDNVETYKVWAPYDSLWAQWVKPVLFIRQAAVRYGEPDIPELDWTQSMEAQTMIIVDLPGECGVIESMALARLGYRPVPLYNGVEGPRQYSSKFYNASDNNGVEGTGQSSSMIVNVSDIASALYECADELDTYGISPEAPPVFMLDSNRMAGRGKQPGKYDNRWCVFPQDMPSASFLLNAGIRRVIVRSDTIQNDLSHILHRYQNEGIEIYLCTGKVTDKKSVVKPSKFKSLSYRFKVISGLARNGAGGFGAFIPEPVESSSGGRYYGFG